MSEIGGLKALEIKIEQKIGELESLREKSISIGSFDYGKDRVQTMTKQNAPYVEMVGKMVDLEVEIRAEMEMFLLQRHRLINEIQGMDDSRYIEVLYKRYVEYKPFEVIAQEMHYNCDYVRHLHREALEVFETSHKISHGGVV